MTHTIFAVAASVIALAWPGHPARADVARSTIHASSDSADVVATVANFHAALAGGDSVRALALLSGEALIVESGSVETRADYRAHHLPADIEFARAVRSIRTVVHVTVNGDVAWITSTSTSQGQAAGRQINSVGAELVVLRRVRGTWQIEAIHWSSRPRRAS